MQAPASPSHAPVGLTLNAISSMATRLVLSELAEAYEAATGVRLALESVGGVDAAKRVQAGEVFDIVFLASDAIDKLLAAGHLAAGSRVDLVRSGVAVGEGGCCGTRHQLRGRTACSRAGGCYPQLFHRPERRGSGQAV